ncbi:hypothetical protein LINGRAPRIM_LOCUS1411 [Linum grandiflorum]
MPKPPPYFRTIFTHIRTAGCYNLLEAYFLLFEEKCTYLDIAFREMWEHKAIGRLSNRYASNNVKEPNWQSYCDTHEHVGPLSRFDKKSSYGSGAYQFLRFGRNVSQHH